MTQAQYSSLATLINDNPAGFPVTGEDRGGNWYASVNNRMPTPDFFEALADFHDSLSWYRAPWG